jgi:hypothetical protein
VIGAQSWFLLVKKQVVAKRQPDLPNDHLLESGVVNYYEYATQLFAKGTPRKSKLMFLEVCLSKH